MSRIGSKAGIAMFSSILLHRATEAGPVGLSSAIVHV